MLMAEVPPLLQMQQRRDLRESRGRLHRRGSAGGSAGGCRHLLSTGESVGQCVRRARGLAAGKAGGNQGRAGCQAQPGWGGGEEMGWGRTRKGSICRAEEMGLKSRVNKGRTSEGLKMFNKKDEIRSVLETLLWLQE